MISCRRRLCGVLIYDWRDPKGSLREIEAVLLALPGDTKESIVHMHGDMAVHRWWMTRVAFDGELMSATTSPQSLALTTRLALPDDMWHTGW
jgi:hypothetical protein